MTELPTTFGKYYLTEKLATGGMAEIFLGKLIGPGGFEKQLVIKQIHPALTGQRHFVDLFVAEAKTLVGLAHGNIVPLYELGVIDDTYFIAMEYIDGPTLWRLSEAMARAGHAVDPGLALYVAAELAKGLDYAHRKGAGVIHRDLSPRNVMLSRDGEVKLVDFGIAVTFGGGGEGEADDTMPTGSFPYMSPEQVARRPLTGQSDLFSLGVLLWEMLVGERLFARDTPEETLAAVTTAPIPAPSARRPTVPPALDALVLRCLEREPRARWSDAGELLSALQRALYALEPAPGAREVAAVVARFCPPLAAGDAATDVVGGDDGPTTELGGPGGDAAAGPATQVMEGGRPRGKRKPTVREASFATHVELDKALGRATPLVPLRAILDEPAAEATRPTGREAEPLTTATRPTTHATDAASAPPRPPTDDDGPRTRVRAPAGAGAPGLAAVRPGARRAWLVATAAVVALLAVLGWRALAGGERRGAPAADAGLAQPRDAGAIDAAAVAFATDAGLDLPSAVDAGATVDAGRRPATTDAGPNGLDAGGARPPLLDAGGARPPLLDAGGSPPPPDAAPAAAGTGRLKVGAVPWGEVYLDGRRLPGTAPRTWEVPAGPHQVDVVLPATEDEPEIRRRFDVVVPAGGEAAVTAELR
ncbi:MAG: protein kinase [Myxococcales bacterium]|nr:protein kinase [Myxococcales bacterium]